MTSQKVAVVTGSNKGIGFAIVKGLCEKFQGIVYLTARDVSRGEAAVSQLKEQGLNPVFHQLDITDQASVDRFKQHLIKTHGGLDLLINNAAVAFRESGGKQAEETMAVNYYGTLRLCEALFPILRQNAKVVNVSSSVGHLTNVSSLDLRAKFSEPGLTVPQLNKLVQKFIDDCRNQRQKEEWGSTSYIAYSTSKVALCALTKVQQRAFDGETPSRGIAINSVHPGYVATDLNGHTGNWTIEQGAQAPLWLALEADNNVKGQYVWKDATIGQWDSAESPGLF